MCQRATNFRTARQVTNVIVVSEEIVSVDDRHKVFFVAINSDDKPFGIRLMSYSPTSSHPDGGKEEVYRIVGLVPPHLLGRMATHMYKSKL